jgi:LPXTG-motif cell wall-anchored protein
MGILNKRNAILGWFVWQVGKRVAKRKAKSAVPAIDTEAKRPNKPAILSAVAALGGALWFWRRRRKGGESETFV